MFTEFVAIDPLAMVLPTSVYLIIQNKLHPNVPLIDVLNEVLPTVNAEQRTAIQARLRTLNGYTGAVEGALGAKVAGARG